MKFTGHVHNFVESPQSFSRPREWRWMTCAPVSFTSKFTLPDWQLVMIHLENLSPKVSNSFHLFSFNPFHFLFNSHGIIEMIYETFSIQPQPLICYFFVPLDTQHCPSTLGLWYVCITLGMIFLSCHSLFCTSYAPYRSVSLCHFVTSAVRCCLIGFLWVTRAASLTGLGEWLGVWPQSCLGSPLCFVSLLYNPRWPGAACCVMLLGTQDA